MPPVQLGNSEGLLTAASGRPINVGQKLIGG
jgi:hypothetical protein